MIQVAAILLSRIWPKWTNTFKKQMFRPRRNNGKFFFTKDKQILFLSVYLICSKPKPPKVMTKTGNVSSTELRELLHHMPKTTVYIRFRLAGHLWQGNFTRVDSVTENGVVLHSLEEDKVYIINDLKDVMQFEIDQRFFRYEPYRHYTHTP